VHLLSVIRLWCVEAPRPLYDEANCCLNPWLRSPVALASDDGYTQLLNGCMDHGWFVPWSRNLSHSLPRSFTR
jgi:hypothetical protein